MPLLQTAGCNKSLNQDKMIAETRFLKAIMYGNQESKVYADLTFSKQSLQQIQHLLFV